MQIFTTYCNIIYNPNCIYDSHIKFVPYVDYIMIVLHTKFHNQKIVENAWPHFEIHDFLDFFLLSEPGDRIYGIALYISS